MTYRMTFRFDETGVDEKDSLAISEPKPVVIPMQVAVTRSRRVRIGKIRIGKFDRMVAAFFVMLVGVLFALIHGHHSTSIKTIAEPISVSSSPQSDTISQLAVAHQLLILPQLHAWMAVEGVYSNKNSAMLEVKTNSAIGVPSFVTAKPPYQVFLSSLLTPAQVHAEEAKWGGAEVPFYLTNWSVNQSVHPVPFMTKAQVKSVEKGIYQDYSQLTALLTQDSSATFQIGKVQFSGKSLNQKTESITTQLNQLTATVKLAQILASHHSAMLGPELAKALIDYQAFSQRE